MKIRKDDTVIVIAGKDKGKKGKVLKAFPRENKIIVEGINVQVKHEKPRGPENPGGIQKKESPIDVSNVMYFDVKANKGSRIGYKVEDGKKSRISKASNEKINK